MISGDWRGPVLPETPIVLPSHSLGLVDRRYERCAFRLQGACLGPIGVEVGLESGSVLEITLSSDK